ncbi:flagellar biosynthesis protein FlhB [Acetivibrio mesophilus]|uniref:Flagellar biosynthetic protein FlhB n=1 Tax=Acetivibrio mesophilus TaxID=2487273 RepID=A0A4Q0I7D8_9FIRM|nr:flagellar biosynthesis protein FlhB [Acetivibrio mesophilus]ODM25662.1 flagellar biosynthesis protein FlhB [Clostridium sp. Bc-iso-3]RXE60248.1 flagellar biosynthesis protein FlhB [Acetivibrio mesophilus]HHV29883.1 flagellar biosynthesis protein FlhB [Clostridium sp.]
MKLKYFFRKILLKLGKIRNEFFVLSYRDCKSHQKSTGRIKANLQLFADNGDKTEKATPRKRSKAREEGQVLQSREMNSAIVLLSAFVTLRIFGQHMYEEILKCFKVAITLYPTKDGLFTIDGLLDVYSETLLTFFKIAAPVLLVVLIAGVVSSYAQVGFLFTTKTLAMKLNRINPLQGFKRIFSPKSLVELLKSIIKIAIVIYIGYAYIKGEARNVLNMMDVDVISIASFLGSTITNAAIRMCMALLVIGVADYGYQWWEYEKSLRMSKQEIKEENKEVEGNPEIKSKIRQKQRQMSMRRMLQDIPKADVVITNPTHYAVAVKYDPEKADAPIVVAKGQDYIALRIKEIAKENRVEIVENKPLARTLYSTVEIGGKIPPELYQAVAEVLAFVYSLKEKIRK